MKKVSVIMPMYNVEKVMARSVQSLFSQTLRDLRLCSLTTAARITLGRS